MEIDEEVYLQLPKEWQKRELAMAWQRLFVLRKRAKDTLYLWSQPYLESSIRRLNAATAVIDYFEKAFKPPEGEQIVPLATFAVGIQYEVQRGKFDEAPTHHRWDAVRDQMQIMANIASDDQNDLEYLTDDGMSSSAGTITYTELPPDSVFPHSHKGTFSSPYPIIAKPRGGALKQQFQWRSPETTSCLMQLEAFLAFMWNSTTPQQRDDNTVLGYVGRWIQMSKPGGSIWNLEVARILTGMKQIWFLGRFSQPL